MSARPEEKKPGLGRFRTRLLVAMMLIVSAVTALALFLAQRNVAATARRDLQREFQRELASLHTLQEMRHAALAERCRALARKPRIHAALEDNALDLLYPSARDELLDVMAGGGAATGEPAAYAFHALYYRFLDGKGGVIPPPNARDVGSLNLAEESRLRLRAVPEKPQTGYLWRASADGGGRLDEVIAMPVVSSETGEAIAALLLGFKPIDLSGLREGMEIQSGIWLDGHLHLPALDAPATAALAGKVREEIAQSGRTEGSITVQVRDAPCLLFYKLLNPGSPFPPAYEVCIYPLAESLARQRRLLWQFVGAAGLLLAGAYTASHFVSLRLSVPVEKLAVDSEENRALRERAEAALELTNEELQRSARFSADASHQLKTPVSVLRAGLEELLAGEKLSPEMREEVSALVHQTFRLTSVIEDLLLLSRMDAGRLKLEFSAVDLTPLIEGWLDDLGALPDVLQVTVEPAFPATLPIEGEKGYTRLIVQNLLENARKYNRSGGRIRITAREAGGWCILAIGNTGRSIPPAAREHIFERFHRGAAGENVPGHGLGLNLARELCRLHGGELRLVRSEEDWTEFEACFRPARTAADAAPQSR